VNGDDLVVALEALVDRHRRLGSTVPDYLRAGGDPTTIRSAITAVGLDPPDDLVTLFAWHDGLDSDRWLLHGRETGYPRLWGDVFFGTLIETIEARESYLKIDRDIRPLAGDDYEDTWHPGWFPVFSGGQETYAMDCRDSQTRGSVFEVTWHPGPFGDPPFGHFPSLTAMIQAIVRRFDAGAYSWEPKTRWLDQDDALLARLIATERDDR